MDRAEVTEILLDMLRCPVPGELVHMVDEPADTCDSLVDRVELEVPGELLVAPPGQHVLKRLFLGMQQLNSAQLQHTPGRVDRHFRPTVPSKFVLKS